MSGPLKYTNDGVPKNWDGKDWQQYKWAMEIVFKKKKLTDIVNGNLTKTMLFTSEAEEEFDDNQLTIMQLIGMSLPAEIFHQIRDKSTGTDMWNALCVIYESRENRTTMAHRAESIRHELDMLKLSPGGDVNKHLSKMFNLRTELLSLNYQFDDTAMVELMLNSLPHTYEFESLKSGVRYNCADTYITPERTRELIRVADSRQRVFQAKSGKRSQKSGSGDKQKADGNGQNREKPEKSKDTKKKVKKCFVCDSTEHLISECPLKVKNQDGAGAAGSEQKKKARANVTRVDHNESSSDTVEVSEEVTDALDALLIDARLPAEISEENEAGSNEEKEAGGNEADATVSWWYDGLEHDDHEVDTSSGWWYFDTAANVHVTGNPWYYVAFTPDLNQSQHVHGVTPALASRVAGVGTVQLITEVEGERKAVYLNDVFYVPGATHGLLSVGLATEQGFDFDYYGQLRCFRVKDEHDDTVIVATPEDGTWGFQVSHPSINGFISPQDRPLCNFTVAEGVASLKLWHERLGHVCPQYLKTMVDKNLVRGMMLKQRELGTCDACHIGKQKQQRHWKKLDRNTKAPNQVVYADLLIPSKANGTRFEAVLVILDGYTRFVKVHMLTSKSSEVVNQHMKEYVLWAERQAGRQQDGPIRVKYRVHQVLTDKGGEFVNTVMDNWYGVHGIEHVKVGPKSSQLNLCERTHQSLVEMTKSMMHDAGFPVSLWPEALRNAVYIKNRTYNKGTQSIPYEMMFGIKPDLRHIRKFGSLAYVHVPVTPGRKKHHDNARLGFVLGYAEDTVGCKVYFPDDRTAKFVSDLRISEDVMYRDRHGADLEDDDLESLHFTKRSNMESSTENSTFYESTMDLSEVCNSNAAPMMSEATLEATIDLEGGEDDTAQRVDERDKVMTKLREAQRASLPSRASARWTGLEEIGDTVTEPQCVPDVEGVTAGLPSVLTAVQSEQYHNQSDDPVQNRVVDSEDSASAKLTTVYGYTKSEMTSDDESAVSVCGSLEVNADGSSSEVSTEGLHASENLSESVVNESNLVADENGDMLIDDDEGISQDADDVTIASTCEKLVCKRQRDETNSEMGCVEKCAEREGPKRTRTGLREYHERRRPKYLDDYVVNAVQNTSRVLDENGRPIRASDVQIPRNHREAMRSKYRNYWREAELAEMSAMKRRRVLEEIAFEDVPKDAKPIKTRWVYSVKSDFQGFVIRFKARLVALGNYQRPGVDFTDTFSPVARMSSFRLLVALAAVLNLKLYGGDVDTAYLNALLGILQYVKSIDGFPCEVDGHMYVVTKALYGLRQSGREWNSEINQWLLTRGYQRSLTEPCLYYRIDGEDVILVLVYVDDIVVASKDEESKNVLFEDLDQEYGLKDQGLLTAYLGVEVNQTEEQITITQTKYTHEILEKFGYSEAHAVGNPMEVKARFVPLEEGETSDTTFPYREAVGMLMYLATSTRPDLAFALSQLSRFVASPSSKHVGALKRVLRYLAGTVNYGITYDRQEIESKAIVLEGHCDSDWANDPETRKSTTGFVFTLAGGAISWMSRRQSIVALSTAEAEYVAACEAAMEAIAESNILQEILPHHTVELRIGIDNQAAHVLATNPTYSRRTRHIELRWHYVREQVERGVLNLHKVKGDENPADAFTKALDKVRLKNLVASVGIADTK